MVTHKPQESQASPAVAATAARPHGAMADRGRLKKELSELQKDTNAGVTVTPKGDQLTELEGTITGPDDTPYAGGFYRISISIPSGYPFEPPKMKRVRRRPPRPPLSLLLRRRVGLGERRRQSPLLGRRPKLRDHGGARRGDGGARRDLSPWWRHGEFVGVRRQLPSLQSDDCP